MVPIVGPTTPLGLGGHKKAAAFRGVWVFSFDQDLDLYWLGL